MVPESIRKDPELLAVRWLVWLYFWLLLFEGALAKWAFPSIAEAIFQIKDILLLFAYGLMSYRHRFPQSGFLVAMLILGVLMGLDAQLYGHKDWLVTLYGLKVDFLGLPLMFIVPDLFSLDDVKLFGRLLLYVSIPMALLVIGQFLSPAENTLNAAISLKPTGTFYAVPGLVCFLSLQAAFLSAFFLEGSGVILSCISLVALFFSLAFGLTLGAPLACAIILAMFILGLFINPKPLKRGIIFVLWVGLIALMLSFAPFYSEAAKAMSLRFEKLSSGQPVTFTLMNHVQQGLSGPIEVVKTVSLQGAGVGSGTYFASRRWNLLQNFRPFTNEWSRLLIENGLVLGIAMIIFRIVLASYFVYWGVRCMKKSDNFLPWILTSSIFPLVLWGLWGQPEVAGFAAIGSGFILAATRKSYESHPLFKHAYSSLRR